MADSREVMIGNKQLTCPFCGNSRFYKHDVRLNKKWFAALDFEFFSKTGQSYICDSCGLKQEFYPV
ncbi:MAG: hypothetical protein ACXQTP_02440 [Candidatus Methanofastidiosia archaeon]